MTLASNSDLFVSMERLEQRLEAFEQRVVRLMFVTQTIGVSLVAFVIWLKS